MLTQLANAVAAVQVWSKLLFWWGGLGVGLKRIGVIRKGIGIGIIYASYSFLIKGTEYIQNSIPIPFNRIRIIYF